MNFEMITQLVNTRSPENSYLLAKPLEPKVGGLGHTGGTYWTSRERSRVPSRAGLDSKSLPADRYVPPPAPPVDFEFFRACVQNVFATPREGHIKVQQLPRGWTDRLCAGPWQKAVAQWNEEEARQAFRGIARLNVAGNPVQSRFLLKPLHPDGGGSYAHNGPRALADARRSGTRRALAAGVRGDRKGTSCS